MPRHNEPITVQGFQIQDAPRIYLAAIPGRWLLAHTTPSWRIEDPTRGFQRMVREERARAIALAVLDQRRTFPNSIVLATDIGAFSVHDSTLMIPDNTKLLVVDGQHRLWAQKFSTYGAIYSCVLHMGLSEVEMARLFLEINDNQKRVPSSLRWDLVRLVRPDDDPVAVGAAEMVLQLATDEGSPLFQRIDLTGEQTEIRLKQGSIAPSLKQLLSRRSPMRALSFDQQYRLVVQYFIAIRELDEDGWKAGQAVFYGARVVRALLLILPDIINDLGQEITGLTYESFRPYLARINADSLVPEAIRASQGEAGIRAIYKEIKDQIFACS
jgi:DGQHR domain-containing protein